MVNIQGKKTLGMHAHQCRLLVLLIDMAKFETRNIAVVPEQDRRAQ